MVEGTITAQSDSCAHDVAFVVEGAAWEARFVSTKLPCSLPQIIRSGNTAPVPFTSVAFATTAAGEDTPHVVSPAALEFVCF